MKLEHYFITFVDLPEILPFTLPADTEELDLEKAMDHQEKSGKMLFDFVSKLEKKFSIIHYIGQDNIEGKFYQRFLFAENGFMEIMQKAPVAVIAHFSDKKTAENFAKALKQTVLENCKNKKIAKMLIEDIKVSEEKEEGLSYERWSKMKNIRESLF